MTTPPECDTIALEVIACPFCSCSCCRWQRFSARRAASNNPRPGSVRGFFLCLIAAGRPKSPQEPPSAPQSRAPVRTYARHPLAPSAPVLVHHGHACAAPAMPAEYAAPPTMPLQGVLSGFIVRHTSDRVNAFSRAMRLYGVPCDAVRVAPSRRLYRRPPRTRPGSPKRTRPEASHILAAFPSGFYSVFARILSGLRSAYTRLIVAGIVARHSRLIVA